MDCKHSIVTRNTFMGLRRLKFYRLIYSVLQLLVHVSFTPWAKTTSKQTRSQSKTSSISWCSSLNEQFSFLQDRKTLHGRLGLTRTDEVIAEDPFICTYALVSVLRSIEKITKGFCFLVLVQRFETFFPQYPEDIQKVSFGL